MILFIFIASSAFIIAVIRQIWIAQSWVWQTWVWIRVLWYLVFLWFLFTCQRVNCWCFCVLHFRTNRSWIQRWSNNFNIFALFLKFGIFVRNFKIGFIVLPSIFSYCCYNLCSFLYNMLGHTPMCSIQRYSNGTGSGDTDIRNFFNVSMVRRPWVTSCGPMGWMVSAATSILHCE